MVVFYKKYIFKCIKIGVLSCLLTIMNMQASKAADLPASMVDYWGWRNAECNPISVFLCGGRCRAGFKSLTEEQMEIFFQKASAERWRRNLTSLDEEITRKNRVDLYNEAVAKFLGKSTSWYNKRLVHIRSVFVDAYGRRKKAECRLIRKW